MSPDLSAEKVEGSESKFGVLGLRLRVEALESRGFTISGLDFKVWGLEFRVQGFRVPSLGV